MGRTLDPSVPDYFPPGIVVATIAFGMGIDKPDVRWIAHTMMPSSLEVYHQEIGRRADCTIFYREDDYGTWQQRFLAANGQIEAALIRKLDLLDVMDNYCVDVVCRHKAIMAYFGQAIDTIPCDACDVCLNP